MKSFFRDPNVEEGVHNLIFQNRCGNRLTLLIHTDHAELEFVYKPNAYRYKDFRSRNFSNRDNFTTLFAEAALPQVAAPMVKTFDYDPFVTRLHALAESQAKNLITIVNVIDENCFAMAARCPLVLSFRPHNAFEVRDGLITESFADRGESIMSFIAFDGFEANRFRVLDDGRHVLQLIENDMILIGGEDSASQVQRIVRKFAGMRLDQLVERNERIIEADLSPARLQVSDARLQRVIDLNKRLVWSGLDEGGACFGAINRIYHLIWVRDGSMSNSYFALGGNPRLLRLWAPFLLRNPSIVRKDDGSVAREYLQLAGTRWSKSEDDGLYYLLLSLYTLYQTTGDDSLLSEAELRPLVAAVDHAIATRLDAARGIIGSDTRGETTLASSPYFGYDTVNGEMDKARIGAAHGGKTLARCYSLYNNVNTFSVLRMMDVLLGAQPALKAEVGGRYAKLARDLAGAIDKTFLREDGTFWADLLIYSDGSEKRVGFETPDADWWEYVWANTTGPFFVNLPAALMSARMIRRVWPTIVSYGYCPWNTLARMLKEYGMSSADYLAMQDQQLSEALLLTKRYPMVGAVTEYQKDVESWRGLPFGVATLVLSAVSQLLQPMPMGVAVRASDVAESVENFAWRTARIDVSASGAGDVVGSVTLNGLGLRHTLQLPEGLLRLGHNSVEVKRATEFGDFRLYSSSAALLSVEGKSGRVSYQFNSPVDSELVLENYARAARLTVEDAAGRERPFEMRPLPETNKTVVSIRGSGDFHVIVELR